MVTLATKQDTDRSSSDVKLEMKWNASLLFLHTKQNLFYTNNEEKFFLRTMRCEQRQRK